MLNINLFGGPSTGKSTTASGLFSLMKHKNYKVEYVQEFAKDLIFSKDTIGLNDQIYVLGQQHHRMFKLQGQVDYIVHDSPLMLSAIYVNKDLSYASELVSLVYKLQKSYNNLNIFIKRNDSHSYKGYGRSQTLSEAEVIDRDIKKVLDAYNIKYIELEMGKKLPKKILKLIKGL